MVRFAFAQQVKNLEEALLKFKRSSASRPASRPSSITSEFSGELMSLSIQQKNRERRG